jgi:hypothetical protein
VRYEMSPYIKPTRFVFKGLNRACCDNLKAIHTELNL